MDYINQPSSPETPETNVVVIDVPANASAEDASRWLNEPYERGYYIHRAMEHGLGSLRVVYVHRDRPAAAKNRP